MTTTINGTRYITVTSKTTGAQFLKLDDEHGVPAEILALVTSPAWLVEAAGLPLFKCQDCGAKSSARHLFSETDVPGSCDACSRAFFYCESCDDPHHPDDPCNFYSDLDA